MSSFACGLIFIIVSWYIIIKCMPELMGCLWVVLRYIIGLTVLAFFLYCFVGALL